MNVDKLRECFSRALGIPLERVTDDLAYNTIGEWDSVGHMALIAEIETAFDVMFDTDDILGMSTVAKGREILTRYGVGFDAAEGRVALVTGASRGIGAAIARAFAQQGATLLLSARSEGVDDLARELGGAMAPVRAIRGDLGDPAFTKELIASVRKEHGRLDVLVNNAGILRQGLVGMTSAEHMRELYEVNVQAVMSLTQYATRLMDGRRAPSIVNLASIAGTRGMEGVTAYAASKAAVVGYTLSCAKELAPKGIRVNAIAPGFIDTDMVRGVTPDWYERRIQSIRMGRIGTPEDVAGVAVFLASDLSRYVTGQVIGVDGGMMS